MSSPGFLQTVVAPFSALLNGSFVLDLDSNGFVNAVGALVYTGPAPQRFDVRLQLVASIADGGAATIVGLVLVLNGVTLITQGQTVAPLPADGDGRFLAANALLVLAPGEAVQFGLFVVGPPRDLALGSLSLVITAA